MKKRNLIPVMVAVLIAGNAHAFTKNPLLLKKLNGAAGRVASASHGKSGECEDFQGTWKGRCTLGAEESEDKLTVEQFGCQAFTMNGSYTPVDGIETNVVAAPQGDESFSDTATSLISWNGDRTSLTGDTFLISKNLKTGHTFQIRVKATIKKEAEKLVMNAKVLGLELNCVYDKEQK